MRVPSDEAPGGVRLIDRKQKRGVSRGWGQGTGCRCLMGAAFQLGKMEEVWRWTVVTVTQQREWA